MKTIINTILLMGLLGLFAGVSAAPFDGEKVLLCATQIVNQCDEGLDCTEVYPASANIPDFIIVDAANKSISEIDFKNVTTVERIEHLDGKLVLQGADDGFKDVRDGIAWTMTINEDSGKMILSATGDGFVMVVFGACAVK
ncbi:MAG: hypothetical protein DRQ39_03975 [Gammaproteobacteria bacterium]|nr:MAG: hypothetical protein DRQ39_03975 [Gammaproteobacteria bacterium]RKZ96106.1 MAG: hypothetical protein DRQ40_01910 [Gammaproteobacteria bacterium]RKZ98929.1 MAG: hypothetical protein DRQ46_00655 [Gammaproteobacteria bacterium]RLA02043.1 MAG: hypothetical protein DRQ42_01735 [Gammaproteobacteria bacterium]HHA19023.1 hypothetical protein [Methylophaga sp.]